MWILDSISRQQAGGTLEPSKVIRNHWELHVSDFALPLPSSVLAANRHTQQRGMIQYYTQIK